MIFFVLSIFEINSCVFLNNLEVSCIVLIITNNIRD